MNIKEKKIIDLHVSIPESAGKDTKFNFLCSALYESALGTKHFYAAQSLLADCNEEYREEFALLQTKSSTN
ncbi:MULTISPECIES: hypothetical protein [Enterobacteriaceae]|uniref:hypothetical protein n=1 Tax=Enterobacteriaceae TaxID=543 RepID=UPI000DE614CC|nr:MULTISPECIES: hypothetical protein [Enterobacteriaceae]MCJ9666072.1 hypothetical protein [Escherichia coli]SSF98515.1 Uncharacterised protein [Klebsiella pneumoniae]